MAATNAGGGTGSSAGSALERLTRAEYGRVLAIVIRLVGDFAVAEEAVSEALAVAAERWPREGEPANPRAWLVATARHKALDALRRAGRLERIRRELGREAEPHVEPDVDEMCDAAIPDERLRLIFTCCHPMLALEAQVALALRTLCGLSTEEIARAFLVPPATLAQRIVRAKRRIAEARVPYEVPPPELLPERLGAVLAVVYLVFNEGYAASRGDALLRTDLCAEAIRLGRLVVELLRGPAAPGGREASPEAAGLLALMLLHDARRATRTDEGGDLVLLEDQDRSRWDRAQIEEGLALARVALASPRPGPYALQAAIAAEHVRAAHVEATDWAAIARHYAALAALRPSPVVELNRAVAVAMAEGPAAGLARLDELERAGALAGYHHFWSAKADLLRRLGRRPDAADAYRRALELAATEPERRFLARRLAEMA
ncbi:MAG TPA: RNA polymerase sigma factor [Myxococcota bacterium]|nr:RNA polymerase sigma factor [Myxococcota bacterium]